MTTSLSCGHRTISATIAAQADARGEAAALMFEGRLTSYAELERTSNRIAYALLAAGMQPGERIAHLGKNSDLYFELLVGAAKARVILVPLNWRLADTELQAILADCAPRIAFVGAEYSARGQVLLDPLEPTCRLVSLESAADLFGPAAEYPDTDPGLSVDPEDVVLIMYTSGTTGRAKGAMLTHRSILRTNPPGVAADPEWFTWRPSESALIAMPIFHIGGTGQGLRTLRSGGCAIVLREFDPRQILDAVVRHRIAKLFLVPSALRLLLDSPNVRGLDYSSLEYILYGASPISADLLREALAVFRCGFVQMYGMTETSGTIVALGPEEHASAASPKMRSAGRCLPGVEIQVRAADGAVLPPGEIGEIFTRSSANMSGYWGLPEATAEVLECGWLRTGDAGYLDQDGYLFVHDRMKDLIISGGENIYPAEVEAAISSHPAVAEVAVVAVPSERWGEEVKAIVVPKAGCVLDPAAVLDWARARIAAYKVPKTVSFVESLPRNSTGKLLRRQLRESYWAGRVRRVN